MKIKDLKFGDMFRYGKQKNYRQFLQSHLLEGLNISAEHVGKLAVYYDNCKELIINPETEVEVSCHRVKGYSDSYSTSTEKREVSISGQKTEISYFLKDGNRLMFVYSIKNSSGEFVDLDVRNVDLFPKYSYEEMRYNGLNLLEHHIKSNPEAYVQFIKM